MGHTINPSRETLLVREVSGRVQPYGSASGVDTDSALCSKALLHDVTWAM